VIGLSVPADLGVSVGFEVFVMEQFGLLPRDSDELIRYLLKQRAEKVLPTAAAAFLTLLLGGT
jgi:hypothetical protein